ncbi:AfsR/SARP family transcriptional regulator [Nocardiopsis dassonvillei]|uniref:AfsR/SARP family transcriptional regulator n=1 Tax=Nocardiopsis dassonvillei TaxID=2014 RepID=UPI00362ACFE3
MEFRLLGPVEVIDKRNNAPKNLLPTAPKPRQVLSLLALRRNTLVQTKELIDELWESDPPISAMTTLQTYIYKIRKALEVGGKKDLLMTRPGGYTLRDPDFSLDVQDFETKSNEGRLLLEKGENAVAGDILRDALRLWRGPALADVAMGRILSSYAIGLEELRTRTLEMRIEADLSLGYYRELISELKKLVLTDPLNENLHVSLMNALLHSNRRYEALEVYQNLRHNMVEELGIDPGRQVRELHQAMLSDSHPEIPTARVRTALVPRDGADQVRTPRRAHRAT